MSCYSRSFLHHERPMYNMRTLSPHVTFLITSPVSLKYDGSLLISPSRVLISNLYIDIIFCNKIAGFLAPAIIYIYMFIIPSLILKIPHTDFLSKNFSSRFRYHQWNITTRASLRLPSSLHCYHYLFFISEFHNLCIFFEKQSYSRRIFVQSSLGPFLLSIFKPFSSLFSPRPSPETLLPSRFSLSCSLTVLSDDNYR